MAAPTRGSATSTTQIEVDWSLLTNPSNGGSEVTSYQLVWDAGTGSTTSSLVGLLAPYTQASYVVTTGVTLGSTYKFKVRAQNVYGWGGYSPEFSIVASEAPAQMQVATTSIVGTAARISWVAPASNGEPITAYRVKVLHSDGVTYSEEPVSCSGTEAAIVSNLRCDIPLTTLRASPFNLVLGDLVRATVAAGNAQGYGLASQVNTEGGTVQTEPAKTVGLTFDAASSSTTAITFTWTAPSGTVATGASPITGYYVDGAESAASPAWAQLGQVSAGTESFTATGLTGGVTYVYRVQAVNIHGAGEASDTLSALAASVPDQPGAPTTTQIATGVRVAWTAPVDNHYAVLEYEISVADSSGTLQVDASLCDGSSASVIADLYCIIPMSSLTSAPYSLSVDTLVEFAVRARNARGWSPLSSRNSAGVLAQTVPAAMPSPTTDPTRTGETQVFVQWTAHSASTDTGGSAVTSYHLQSDQGLGDGSWTDILGYSPASLATSIELTGGIVAGTTYIFRVRASNLHGWGAWSPQVPIKAAQVPYKMATVSTAVESTAGAVTITWLAPADGSDPITAYRIEIRDATAAWVVESTYCDGTDSAVLSGRTCTVPMSALRTSPFSLAFDALVEVRASARNSYGWGAASDATTVGARIRREPDAMAAPVAVGVAEARIDL